MSALETKLAPAAASVLAGGEFAAIVSTPQPDSVGDIVLPSAFTPGQQVPILVGHVWTGLPVGKATILPTATDTRASGVLFDTIGGRDAAATLAGLGPGLSQFSIGFRADQTRDENRGGERVRVIEKLTLFEISIVVAGASVGTGLVGAKRLDPEIEQWVARFKKLQAIYGPTPR